MSDEAVGVGDQLRAQGRHTGLLEPQAGPGTQVASRDRLQLAEQVAQLGVGVGVRRQVALDAGEEVVTAHVSHERGQDRGPLGVGDSVEVDLDVVQVVDLRGHGVGGGQLVLVVGPPLLQGLEGRPGLVPAGDLGGGQGGGVLGEGLVEPQVVPPGHGDHVPEPHVGQLVQDRHGSPLHAGLDGPGSEDVVVAVGDAAGVLHRSGVELGNEDLVVLGEGVGGGEQVLVVGEAPLGQVQDLL